MRNIFVFEWICGGGLQWLESQRRSRAAAESPAHHALLGGEGREMLKALTEDLVAAGNRVSTLISAEVDAGGLAHCHVATVSSGQSLRASVNQFAGDADQIIIIAPESNRQLATCREWLGEFSDKVLGPSPKFMAIACSKHNTCRWLAGRDVPVPRGVRFDTRQLLDRWARGDHSLQGMIVKPDDGQGGLDVHKVTPSTSADSFPAPRRWRVEQCVPGIPAGVLALCGPRGIHCLPACRQRLSGGDHGRYVGGEYPLADHLQQRAWRLAVAALHACPPARGFVGLDMVLGNDARSDYVIEINPRLTSSYLLLRRRAQFNLAAAMLHVARGAPVDGTFDCRPASFHIEAANDSVSFA